MRRRVGSLLIRTASMVASAAAVAWAVFAPIPVPQEYGTRRAGAARLLRLPTVADTTFDSLIARAVERDPFSAARRQGAETTANAPATVENEELVRVLGTVVDSAEGSFALCQLGASAAVILRIGQRIGAYELRRIEKGSVVFATPTGGRLELRIQKAGV